MRFEGRRFGRYLLHCLIGRGGAGEVYLADDQHIPRQVAVKTIQSDNLSIEEAKDTARLFLREARAIAILNHPHVLPLFDFGEENLDGIAISYLVTPFCPEGSLPTWLQRRHRPAVLSSQELVPLLQQAADALAYAHEQGIVHRDVKPSNFLVRTRKVTPEQPDLLLADFGIARFTMSNAHISQTVRGTPIYMSPEQWSGDSSNATDQYSLAVMAYELLTGRPPFQGTTQQVMYQHSTTPPQPPSAINSQLTPAIDKIILRALAKEPNARFPSIADFAYAFTQTVQEEARQLFPPYLPKVPVSQSEYVVTPIKVVDKNTPHASFPMAIQNSDLRTKLHISMTEAARGGQHSLPLSSGQIVNVTLPPGVYDGQEVYLENFIESSTPGDPKRNLIIQIAVSADVEVKTLIPVTEPRHFLWKTKRLLLIGSVLAIFLVSAVGVFSVGNSLLQENNARTTTANQAFSTAYAATSAALNAQTSLTAQLNATATAAYNPYDSTLKTLALYEPLDKNSSSQWDEKSGSCTFAADGYHVTNPDQTELGTTCIANNTDVNSVSFEVQMTLITGTSSGIVLYSANATSYYLLIRSDRTYTLQACNGGSCNSLLGGYCSWINPGQKQLNLIALSAMNNTISVYINKYDINSTSGSISSHSHLGLVAGSGSEVVFRSAKVWTP